MNYFAYAELWPWVFVPAALAVFAWLGARHRRRALERLGRIGTVERLLPQSLSGKRRAAAVLKILGLLLFVLALLGPLIGAKLTEFKQKGLDVFVAVDCSLSMQTEDLKPNRMAYAKIILQQLIDRLAGSRIGVIAFAGQAYVECPLTIDTGAAKEALDAIDVGSVPVPGTVIGDAIRTAVKGLKAGEGAGRVLVLLTDGEDHHSDPEGAAKDAARVGLKIFTIGIGTQEGQPIPISDQDGNRIGYKQDKKGETVISKLDPKTLIAIAQETGGQYWSATPSGDEIDPLVHALESLQQGDQKTQLFNRFENRYQWPLALGILLLVAGLAIPEMSWN